MTGSELFERATSYGEAVSAAAGYGPLWRHACGRIAWVDLLADEDPRQPWEQECKGCQGRRREDWVPLFAYTGPLCDQCQGNGCVLVPGQAHGVHYNFETATECEACGGSGIASGSQPKGVFAPEDPAWRPRPPGWVERPAPVGSWWQTEDGVAYVDGDYLDGPGDQIITYVLHRPDGSRSLGKWDGREFADAYTRLDGPPAWCAPSAPENAVPVEENAATT